MVVYTFQEKIPQNQFKRLSSNLRNIRKKLSDFLLYVFISISLPALPKNKKRTPTKVQIFIRTMISVRRLSVLDLFS
ncbi:hypothetical protein RA13_11965 [Bacillus atrophaeus]|nr:hypothetical protein RA13_11965 [Bacillus atrophaeus]